MKRWVAVALVTVTISATDGYAQGSTARVTAERIELDSASPHGLAVTEISLPVGVQPSDRFTTLPDTQWSCRAWQRQRTGRAEVECRFGTTRAGVHVGGPPTTRSAMLVSDGDVMWEIEVSWQ